MALYLGLDIGTRTVTGAVFSGKPKSFRLVDFFVEEIPSIESMATGVEISGDPAPEEAQDADGDAAPPEEGGLDTPESFDAFLQGVLRERKLEQAEVFTSFDTKDCIVREFTVPFTKEEQIQRVVSFEAEDYFPGLDLDEYSLEYLKIGERAGKSQLVVWALKKEKIAERLALLKGADVDPVALDLDAAALYGAFALTPTYDEEKSTLLIDMGSSSSRILLVEQGQLRMVRALRMQGGAPALSADRLLAGGARREVAAATSAAGARTRVAETGGGSGGGSGGGTGAAGAREVAVEIVGSEDPPASYASTSIESRFREIEEALRKLDPEGGPPEFTAPEFTAPDPEPLSQELPSDLEGPDLGGEGHEPIAILSDEEYDLVRSEESEELESDSGGELPPELDLLGTAADPDGAADSDDPIEARMRSGLGVAAEGEDGPGSGEGLGGSEGAAENGGTATPGLAAAPLDHASYLERVALEIQRSLIRMRLSSPVELICVTGGMAAQLGARDYFSQEFDVETIELDFGDSFPTDLDARDHAEVGRVGAVAVGLGTKVLAGDPLGVDYRKGEFRYEHKLEKLRLPLLLAALLFFVFSLQAVFWSIQEWQLEGKRLSSYQVYSAQTFDKFFKKKLTPGRDPYQAAIAEKKKWTTGEGSAARDALYIPAIEAVENFSKLLGSTGAWFDISNMTLNFKASLPRRKGSTRPGQDAKSGGPRPPSKSTLNLESNEARLTTKIYERFRGKDSWWDVKVGQPASRGENQKYNLDLTIKASKLRDLGN